MSAEASPKESLRSELPFFAIIGALSAVAVAVIGYVLLVHRGDPAASARISFLPAVNACLNAASATLLVVGVRAIRRKERARHRAAMLGAFAASGLFLIGYLGWHAVHGDTKYPAGAPLRGLYLFVLASHVVLSIAVVPLAFTTLWLALRDKLGSHRRLAKVTFPLWLYVSVTGVLVFAMLRAVTR